MANNQNNEKRKGKQGFASMDTERQKEIASKGGRQAHRSGKAHEWNSEEAAKAGRKGGKARAAKNAEQNQEENNSDRSGQMTDD